jgi:hypothetical protein
MKRTALLFLAILAAACPVEGKKKTEADFGVAFTVVSASASPSAFSGAGYYCPMSLTTPSVAYVIHAPIGTA